MKQNRKEKRNNDSNNQKSGAISKIDSSSQVLIDSEKLIKSLTVLDSILQFLTKATGQTIIDLDLIDKTLPSSSKSNNENSVDKYSVLSDIPELICRCILSYEVSSSNYDNNNDSIDNKCKQNEFDILSIDNNERNKTKIIKESNTVIKIGYPEPSISGRVYQYLKVIQQNNNEINGSKLLISNASLHGNSKTSAKKRLMALKRSLKLLPFSIINQIDKENEIILSDGGMIEGNDYNKVMDWIKRRIISCNGFVAISSDIGDNNDDEDEGNDDKSLKQINEKKKFYNDKNEKSPSKTKDKTMNGNDSDQNHYNYILSSFFGKSFHILPNQASYAGCQKGRRGNHVTTLPKSLENIIPKSLLQAFSLDKNKLYSHQVQALESILLHDRNTFICTSTGSGKSLCFLLPVLTKALLSNDSISLLIFPTKALAQDQYHKLQSFLNQHTTSQNNLNHLIRPGVIDGDTPHKIRSDILSTCNIIYTNPDTIHAAFLPNWNTYYRRILSNLEYIVLDEAHIYNGIFGNHVSFVFKRLYRLVHASKQQNRSNDYCSLPIVIACSATIDSPVEHFSNFCYSNKMKIISEDDDGSPSIPKYYFVWNPPILDSDGITALTVVTPSSSMTQRHSQGSFTPKRRKRNTQQQFPPDESSSSFSSINSTKSDNSLYYKRRHAADETAYLLSKAIQNKTRVIAFCKTRSLVEWVYNKTYHTLNDNSKTSHLTSQLESYRGGYSKELRRGIEQRFFQNELLGIVTTNALELGIDIGGIDLTLHCGYPGSYASLLQQSGRAGRSGSTNCASSKTRATSSVSIVICFNSPAEQYLWLSPTKLLSRPIKSIQEINNSTMKNAAVSISQEHLLCAAAEYPLMQQSNSICKLLGCYQYHSYGKPNDADDKDKCFLSDDCLFFGNDENALHYNDTIECLLQQKYLQIKNESNQDNTNAIECFVTHPFLDNPWSNLSLRSIEPIHYSLVDTSHPLQKGVTSKCLDKQAILDTIPYSRIFYHAFPGAVIMHRGKSYLVSDMNHPPSSFVVVGRYNGDLCAFLKPIKNVGYYTRARRAIKITIVKRLECMDVDTNFIANDDNIHGNTDMISPVKSNDTKFSLKNIALKEEIEKKDLVMNNSESIEMLPNTDVHSSVDFSTNKEKNTINTNSGRSIGGNGIVNVKHVVYGYVKLSTITHAEIARNEISLSPMEYDTYALWLDTEATILSSTLPNYNAGVHALSHAILAVIPLFVSCAISDVDCDHSLQNATRVLIYDVTVGGSGTSRQVWDCMFGHNGGDGIFKAALDLLRHCPSCDNSGDGESGDRGHIYYDGGCPACLHSCPCTNFNTGLSRKAACVIGERIHERWVSASVNNALVGNLDSTVLPGLPLSSPSSISKKRVKSPQNIQNQYVVGRPSWPCFDQSNDLDNDDCGTKSNSYSTSENKGIQGGGFFFK